MRFITANLNGVRSAASKGFFDWLDKQRADAVGVQELKAQADVVEAKFRSCDLLNGHFHYAEKKGYSGVGLYTKEEPSDLITGLAMPEFDCEGRWVEKRFDKPGRKLSLISVYFPSGTSGEERQQVKFRFLAALYPHLMALKRERELLSLRVTEPCIIERLQVYLTRDPQPSVKLMELELTAFTNGGHDP